MTPMKTRMNLLFALTLAAGPLTACKDAPPLPASQPSNVGIETTVAHSTRSTDSLEVPAHVVADPAHVVHIYPPLSGRILGLNILILDFAGASDLGLRRGWYVSRLRRFCGS